MFCGNGSKYPENCSSSDRYIESVHHQGYKDGFSGFAKMMKMLYPKHSCIYKYYYDALQKCKKPFRSLPGA